MVLYYRVSSIVLKGSELQGVLYDMASSIVLKGSELQGVLYDMANSIVLYDLHFLRVDLNKSSVFLIATQGNPRLIGVTLE